MIEQLMINGKKSFDDFGLLIGERKISNPKKKSIKESVPFSNITYDFSKINGELYWEERTLEYSFDIAEFTTKEMEIIKSKALTWLLNVHDTDIYDPYIGDYHYHGSYDSDSWVEDFGAGTLTITFSVYPYKISNEEVKNTIENINGEQIITIFSDSSHRIIPTIISEGNFTIELNEISYSVGEGIYKNENFYFESGENNLKINGSGNIKFSYIEEMF